MDHPAAVNDLYRILDTRYGRHTIFANDTGAVSQSLVRYGEWAENEVSFLRAMIDVGATILDVGAYVGTHALAFARFVGPSGHVVAIEPQIRTFELLKSNIETNAIHNVRLENSVASFEIGELTIPLIDIEQPGSFGSASLLDAQCPCGRVAAVEAQPRRVNDLTVRSITVDSLGIAAPTLIKIDAEGMEDLVLRGARETMLRSSPIIYAECNSLEYGLRSFNILKTAGYRVYAHVVSPYNSDNFRGSKHNIFGTAREVALLGGSGVNLARIERYQVRPCEMLLDIETADDLVLALLNKPQYGPEELRRCAAAKSGGAGCLDEVDAVRFEAQRLRRDVQTLHEGSETDRHEIERLHNELERLHYETERAREALQAKADASLLQAGLMRREADRLRAANIKLRQECDGPRGRATTAKADLLSIYRSHSWHLTSPVRAVATLFRRGRSP